MSAPDLAAMRARTKAATPGPWEWDGHCAIWVEGADWLKLPVKRDAIVDTFYSGSPRKQADAEFIAHAREDMPALLALVEEMRPDAETRDYLTRTIATIRNHRDADNCWPQWANALADEIERLWSRLSPEEPAP